MKQTNASLRWVLALVLLIIGGSWGATNTWAQKVKAHGVVKDATGEPLIGVAIKVLEEEGKGTVTNFDGEFNIEVERSATLRFSYVGFTPQDISLKDATFPLNVVLKEDQETLGELVVIGYGAVEKKDLTGSITAIGSDDFKKGLISTPDQLISGKVAGVQIVSGGGSPGAGSKIRIRGGASLNASNDPLIVIDGVPLEGSTLPGAPSPLSSINPADIESMNILKDASATAIYGSRASNGVIIITTKRGKLGQPLQIHASTRFSVSTPKKYVDVLTGNEVRQLVQQYGTESHKEGVGTESTDWQRAIFQNAFGTDNNVSISGATSWLPYRVSVGYYNENGILRTDHMQRLTGDLSLNPRFFDGNLAVDLNVKASRTNNRYADRGAIGAALSMDPTHPVTSDDPFYAPFGGYWFYHSINDAGLVIPTSLANINPLALLNDREDEGVANRIISNINIGYQMPFIEGLRANLNIAYDYGASGGNNYVPVHSIVAYTNQKVGKGGVNNIYQQEKVNKLLDFYLNYKTEVESIQSSFDVMAGYSYQDWKTTVHNFSDMTAGGIEYNLPAFPLDYPQNTLVSFYGRLNYSLMGRYLLTATVRADGSSRFAPENRWGIFPSFAFAWRAKDEAFLQDIDVLSDLKLRLGYGVTGQQDGIANYSYQGVYALSGNQSKYLFGDTWYNMYKPLAYDADIKWEQTATSNIGVDFAFLDHRITGSLDVYHKETKDLLNETPIPAGANFSNRLLTNVGEITNDGVELTLAFVPIETTDWRWSIDFNTTWNRTRIKRLNQANDPTFQGVPTGDKGRYRQPSANTY